jgi:hypothetical protein
MTTTASFLSRIGDLRSAAAQNFAVSYTTAAAMLNSYHPSSPPLLQIMKELKFLLAILTILVLVTLCSSASLVTPLVRFPLRKFGVEFGSIEISVLTLSIIVHEIELSPLDVPILQIIFVALFPSANARSIKKVSSSSDCNSSYPRNKIKIQRLKVSLTINSRDSSSANQTISWIKRAVYGAGLQGKSSCYILMIISAEEYSHIFLFTTIEPFHGEIQCLLWVCCS